SDRPELLLASIARAIKSPPRAEHRSTPKGGTAQVAARAVARAMRTRERARDTVVRLTHALRLAVRERGRRLADAGVIDDPADVFYLSYDELLDPPPGVAARVPARRAERERLRTLRLP